MTPIEINQRIEELEQEYKRYIVDSNTKKITLNGSFGKLGSRYSIFYAPTEMIQVTITGQLALLMLIERMELAGIPVVSANTDGIVLKCPRSHEWVADDIIAWWEQTTGFSTEETRYKALYSRDVNNYIAIGEDDSVKLKGAFAPPMGGLSWPNPTAEICTDALVAYYKDGTPIEQTIRACTDVRKFVSVRAVKGGGWYSNRPMIPAKTSKRKMTELCQQYGADSYDDLLKWANGNLEYLGKIVRWYYSTGSVGYIRYQSGNLVPCSEGCLPLMELPESLPDDINFQWYIDNAVNSIL